MRLEGTCINMMVKNEEAYLDQTLRSVLPYAKYAIIVDTGSTDNTKAIIEKHIAEQRSREQEFDDFCEILFMDKPVSGDSINWDGNHLSGELTSIRNEMLKLAKQEFDCDLVWQVDGDEIYTAMAVEDVRLAIDFMAVDPRIIGVMVPIKWCTSDTTYVEPGPFPRTLRIMPSRGRWVGEFPNEFLHVDGIPIHMNDARCVSTNWPFLHMSMALHPERRPQDQEPWELAEEEAELLCLNS